MANMSYCRFENTLNDLEDCAEHILDDDLSEREKKNRKMLIDICRDIVEAADSQDDNRDYEDEL